MNIFKIVSVIAVSLVLAGCTLDGTGSPLAPEYLNLTPDEVLIWRDLSDAQRSHALIYIENGGTLVSSLGAM